MGKKKINTEAVEEIINNTFRSKITVKGKKLVRSNKLFTKSQ